MECGFGQIFLRKSCISHELFLRQAVCHKGLALLPNLLQRPLPKPLPSLMPNP